MHSFDPATPVLLASGTKPIVEVTTGDLVIAGDPQTGETETREVVETHTNLDTDLTDLTIKNSNGQTVTLKTTQHHPFWSDERGKWVDAKELRIGERLRSVDGSIVTVLASRSYDGAVVMHDLTVEALHTYFVVVGNTPVLVHNCDGRHRAEGDSNQDPKYEPKHLRPDTPDRKPLEQAAAGAADGAFAKWDASLGKKILGLAPENPFTIWLDGLGRAAYGFYYGRKAYRDWGGGYPAVHRRPDDYQGRHRADD